MKLSHITLAAVLAITPFASFPSAAQQQPAASTASDAPTAAPLLGRIKAVTIATPDVSKVEAVYSEWLGYIVREKGKVSTTMAENWGAPKAAGGAYVLLSTDANPDVFIRAVESEVPADYTPISTWGWNSFELIVDDIYALEKKLEKSPFKILGTPNPLKSAPSIFTMQVEGPGQEILYFANETGDRAKSSLPLPGGFVGRTFIVILAGSDITTVRDWYADTFSMAKASIRSSGGKVVPHALGLPEGTGLPISLLSLKEPGNRIQLDGYLTHGNGARNSIPGHLPPGNASVSFSVANLDEIKATFSAPPIAHNDSMYGGARAATIIGPAGEYIELIEESRQ